MLGGNEMTATLFDVFRAMRLEKINYKTIIIWDKDEKYEIKVRRLK